MPIRAPCWPVVRRCTGARRDWRFNPLFTRLEREEIEEFGVVRLDVVSRERRVEIAGFLGPEAKKDFAQDLTRALAGEHVGTIITAR